MIACPDCGSRLTYQHTPGCKLAIMDGKYKLLRRYRDDFFDNWPGCAKLSCLPKCNLEIGYCQRLAEAFGRWEAARLKETENETCNVA